jgi:hypothetical protein
VPNQTLLFVFFCLFLCSPPVYANIYATDIHLNGSLKAGVVVPGSPVQINYILNDQATAGVSVDIFSGTNLVWTFEAASGEAGSMTGLNSIYWSGTNLSGSNVPVGIYSVRITAAAQGYSTWTNITDDGPNFTVFEPGGVTVNKNTNSPYYGRVFVGNDGYGEGTQIGILKFNADGSPADEGGFSTGGYPWIGGDYANPSPWKMGISDDDKLYVEDWSGSGVVMSFDQMVSSNYLNVLRMDNYSSCGDALLSGSFVRGAGTNTEIWMANVNPMETNGVGIIRWQLTLDGTVAANDPGEVIVTLTNNSDLTLAPFDVSVATNNFIYTIQRVDTSTDPTMRLLCFPPFTNSGLPETKSAWQIGSNCPSLVNPYGVSVDPTGTYVAVAVRGEGPDDEDATNGAVGIFSAADGSVVTNIIADPYGDTNQVYIDVAWDAVGNLYALDFADHVWRVYSPPGTNQAVTLAAPIIQVLAGYTAPVLSDPRLCMGSIMFTLQGQSNVTYAIQSSGDLINWTTVATNYSPYPMRSICVPTDGSQDFYRAMVASP